MAVMAVAVVSCNKDDGPDNEGDPWTLVQEEYIGISGGVIDTNGIRFEVPSGVFDQSRKISLYISDQTVFGDNQASEVYEIRGLPEEFEGLIPVSIKTDAPLDDDFYLAVAAMQYVPSLEDTVYVWTYLSATDSSGFVKSTIKFVNQEKKLKGGSSDPEFEQVWRGRVLVTIPARQGWYLTSGNHFKVTFSKPGITLAQATKLGEALETAWQKYKDMELDYTSLESHYPIPVTYRRFEESSIPYLGDNLKDFGNYSGGRYFLTPSFDFNSKKCLEKEYLIGPMAGHECFHMIQSLYRTNFELKNWLLEATASYAEELFSTDSYYIPDGFSSHWYRPLTGMQDGATFYDPSEKKVSSAFHGYGMSAIVKYFINHAKVQYPLKVMIEALHNNTHPVEAVFSVVPGEDLSATWEMAMRSYVSKATYPLSGMQRAFIAGELYYGLSWAKSVTLRSDLTIFPSVTYELPDLSATFVNITLEGNFSPEQILDVNITTSGDIGHILYKPYYYIFKENGGETPFLEVPATGTEKLQSLKANNYRIAVLLTNSRHVLPYTGKTQVTVEVRIYGQPVVQTDEASDVTGSSATLNAKINPSGQASTGYFEYGLTQAYGNSIPLDQSAMDGFQFIQVSASLTGLQANKTYHYRIVATNSSGKTEGNNLTFETGDAPQIAIGSNYQGGIIFYLEPGGLHGLIAAPLDQAHAPWGCYGTDIEGTAYEIGTGQANTTMIVNMCGEQGAAKICNDLELNGYDDWFLPSILELSEMHKHVDVIGGFADFLYWSSSNYGSNHAWCLQINTGQQRHDNPKTNDLIRVRAIRAF